MDDGAVGAAQLAATVVLNLALAVAVGALASREASRRWLTAGVLVAFGASATLLWLEAAAMAELPIFQARSALAPLLHSTHYGHAWLVSAAALIVAGAASLWRTDAMRFVAALAIAAFAGSRASMGHAAADGDATWRVAVDALHLLLTSLWIGSVAIAGFVTLPRPWPAAEASARALDLRTLSTTATWALAGILLTGVFNAWRAFGSTANMAGNDYARMLMVKLVLVAVAIGLGAQNRFVTLPPLLHALGSADDGSAPGLMGRFVRLLRVEALILTAAVIAAAVLGSAAPPVRGEGTATAESLEQGRPTTSLRVFDRGGAT